MCRNADVGEYLLGMAQRRIRNRTWWDGKRDTDQPWQLECPVIFQGDGVIGSTATLAIAPKDWAKIPLGKPVVTWDEEIRLVDRVGPPRPARASLPLTVAVNT